MITPDQIKEKLESYRSGYDKLIVAINEAPQEMWRYKPSLNDWCIHEIIVHLADSEANAYIRCRKCIAESGKPIMTYNEAEWAKSLNYLDQDIELALECFRILRLRTYNLIRKIPISVWGYIYVHPENGKMLLTDWLDIYESHVDEHLEQIQNIFTRWKAL